MTDDQATDELADRGRDALDALRGKRFDYFTADPRIRRFAVACGRSVGKSTWLRDAMIAQRKKVT